MIEPPVIVFSSVSLPLAFAAVDLVARRAVDRRPGQDDLAVAAAAGDVGLRLAARQALPGWRTWQSPCSSRCRLRASRLTPRASAVGASGENLTLPASAVAEPMFFAPAWIFCGLRATGDVDGVGDRAVGRRDVGLRRRDEDRDAERGADVLVAVRAVVRLAVGLAACGRGLLRTLRRAVCGRAVAARVRAAWGSRARRRRGVVGVGRDVQRSGR